MSLTGLTVLPSSDGTGPGLRGKRAYLTANARRTICRTSDAPGRARQRAGRRALGRGRWRGVRRRRPPAHRGRRRPGHRCRIRGLRLRRDDRRRERDRRARDRRAAARRRAREQRRDRRRARRAERGQAPRRRPRRGRAAPRARRRRPRRRAARAAAGPHARRHVRRRRLRGRRPARRGRGGRRHARALARSGERRRALVLLGRRRPPRARARASDGPRPLHARPPRRVPRRRRRAVARGPRGGTDAEPVRRLQRPRPPRRDARLRRPPRRRDADHRPLRAPHGGRAAAPGEGPRQGPELHARRAEPPDAGPPALPARRDREQGGGARDRARARPAGGEQGRLTGPLLPRGHGPRPLPRQARRTARAPRRRRRPRRPPARPPPRPPPLHRRPAPGDRARRRGRAALRAADRPAREHGHGRAEDGARHDDGQAAGRPAPRGREARGRGQAALPRPRDPLHVARRHARAGRAGPRRGARPDRVPPARGRRRGMRHNRRVTSDEIRETFLSFFESRDHRRLASASLVPATFDPSVLLTTAGMHPLKPYFSGIETPPQNRLASCQKCFRSTDIENVGNTTRHLTFFEMLGNFSIGEYFKAGAVEFALDLSTNGFEFPFEKIWITVFGGDDQLGLGPDEEAIEAWRTVGVPGGRIVLLGREDNFWQSGPTGPCGPCSELYIDRGPDWGGEDDRPGDETERYLEYWNLVFMQYDQDPIGVLTPLPAKNIDTGLGLNRMALIQQGKPTIFETDQFTPLMDLGRELATRDDDERALRILADHSRATTFLIADGVVPSNEDRGYILRRVMRRAIQQGHRIGIEPGFLPQFVDVVIDVMGEAYPELRARRQTIQKWVRGEEEGFGRTLEQGTRLLDDLLARGAVTGADAFRLHDTYGFPIDLTREIAEERGVPFTGDEEFSRLMDEQRARSAVGGRTRTGTGPDVVRDIADEPSEFTGYEHLEEHTTVTGLIERDGQTFVKLAESPFYAAGGGQISDSGSIECEDGDCKVVVTDVLRAGDDQAVAVKPVDGELRVGERVVARVDRLTRHATACNHTATHLLHAALRERLGMHVHQAGSYVGPDKLRFDFSHTERLSPDDRTAIEDRVNEWIVRNDPVRPITTTLDEAKRLGATALFGEKYGDIVRMVDIADGSYSRELCGGTHVHSTAEIGLFKILSEGSSASNVRRIEAVTGPEAVRLVRERDAVLGAVEEALRVPAERAVEAVAALREEAKAAAKAQAGPAVDPAVLAERAASVDGARVVTEVVEAANAKALMDIADRVKGKLGDAAAIVLGSVVDGRVHLVAAVTPALVQRGVKAGEVVKAAAQVAGGGGGGRDTMAQAGGRDPDKLPDAIAAARAAIEAALS